ncbi:MAG: cytochrome c peroxidase [Pseudomonadota bacterium]
MNNLTFAWRAGLVGCLGAALLSFATVSQSHGGEKATENGNTLKPAGAGEAKGVASALPGPIKPTDYQSFSPARAALGQKLFYDKILSGNRNIACGTCHNHDHGTTDGLSLGVGEGGVGVGPKRRFGTGKDRSVKRVPRNANALFNLGHKDFRVLFHDGRASTEDSYGRGFNTPAEEWLPLGLTSIAATQALFPVTSRVEMAGDPAENEIAAARRERIDHVWPRIAKRVQAVSGYTPLFQQAYGDVKTAGDITMVHIANAIGDFIISEWRSSGAPFDRHLAGDNKALTAAQKRGLDLFYGEAGCAQCHTGALLTDQKFHALALPPLGPGRTRVFDPYPRDVGRMGETDDLVDAYRFRTPSLRNVAATAPYGHNGTYATLEGIVRHHLNPKEALANYDRSQVVLPPDAQFDKMDFVVFEDAREMARLTHRVDVTPRDLDDRAVDDLVAFLHSLTDEAAIKGRLGKPKTVPSGLLVE